MKQVQGQGLHVTKNKNKSRKPDETYALIPNGEQLICNPYILNKYVHQLSIKLEQANFLSQVPLSLRNNFQKSGDGQIICYFYSIVSNTIEDMMIELGILSPIELGEISNIFLFVNQGEDQPQKHYLTCTLVEKMNLDLIQFKDIFDYNIYLFSDLYLVAFSNIEKNYQNFKQFLSDNNQSDEIPLCGKYLIAPLGGPQKNEIYWEEIYKLLYFKQKDQGLNSEPDNQLNKQFIDCNDIDELTLLFTDYIYEQKSKNRTNYFLYDWIKFPKEQKASELLEVLQSMMKEQEINQIYQYLGITPEQAENLSVDEFLYEFNFNKMNESIYGLRQKYQQLQKDNEIIDRSLPIFFCRYTKHINSVDYLNKNRVQQNPEYQQMRTYSPIIKPVVQYVPLQFIQQYPIPYSKFNNLGAIPSICIQLERARLANELAESLLFKSKNLHIIQATSTPQIDQVDNFEVLEVLGDSILKYIMSCYLLSMFPDDDECQLTAKRTRLINNKFLAVLALKNNVQYYIFNRWKQTSEWIPPISLKSCQKSPEYHTKMNMTTMADIMEAIFGACFSNCYLIDDACELIQRVLEVPIKSWLSIKDLNILIDNTSIIPEKLEYDQILQNSELSFKDLFELSKKQSKNNSCSNQVGDQQNQIQKGQQEIINIQEENSSLNNDEKKKQDKNQQIFLDPNEIVSENSQFSQLEVDNYFKFCFFDNLEKNILNYCFKNKILLIEAFNCKKSEKYQTLQQDYQIHEYLGDALIEILVISNAFKYCDERKIIITPNVMQKIKVTLLSNNFMARIAVLLGLHNYYINLDSESFQEIEKFRTAITFDSPFKLFIRHEAKVPKILGDIWESLCGALVRDGGWPAVHQVFGLIYQPFIIYACIHHNLLDYNVLDKIINYAKKEKKNLQLQINQMPNQQFQCIITYDQYIEVEEIGETEKLAKERAAVSASKLIFNNNIKNISESMNE